MKQKRIRTTRAMRTEFSAIEIPAGHCGIVLAEKGKTAIVDFNLVSVCRVELDKVEVVE